MLSWKIRIRRQRPPGMMLREFNGYVRQAMHGAGEYWVTHILPLHFLPSAVHRYAYISRTERYLRRKRRATRVREWRGQWVNAVQPPLPLVWSDALRRSTRRPLSEWNIRATATANRQKVVVPVRLPHPMNPKNAGEITRVNNEDIRNMRRIIEQNVRTVVAMNRGHDEVIELRPHAA